MAEAGDGFSELGKSSWDAPGTAPVFKQQSHPSGAWRLRQENTGRHQSPQATVSVGSPMTMWP